MCPTSIHGDLEQSVFRSHFFRFAGGIAKSQKHSRGKRGVHDGSRHREDKVAVNSACWKKDNPRVLLRSDEWKVRDARKWLRLPKIYPWVIFFFLYSFIPSLHFTTRGLKHAPLYFFFLQLQDLCVYGRERPIILVEWYENARIQIAAYYPWSSSR